MAAMSSCSLALEPTLLCSLPNWRQQEKCLKFMLHTATKKRAKGRESDGRTEARMEEKVWEQIHCRASGARGDRFAKQLAIRDGVCTEKTSSSLHTLFIELLKRLDYKFCSVQERSVRGNYCGRRNARNGWTQKDNTRTTRTVGARAV